MGNDKIGKMARYNIILSFGEVVMVLCCLGCKSMDCSVVGSIRGVSLFLKT